MTAEPSVLRGVGVFSIPPANYRPVVSTLTTSYMLFYSLGKYLSEQMIDSPRILGKKAFKVN